MRTVVVAILTLLLALLALGGAALAEGKGKEVAVTLSVTPEQASPGETVTLLAYVEMNGKAYQGANVEFVVAAAGAKKGLVLHAKPAKPGFYQQQFVAEAAGAYEVRTVVDGVPILPKAHAFQVLGATPAFIAPAWATPAAGLSALALLALGAALLIRRSRLTGALPAAR